MAETKYCRRCGKPFKASPAGTTVHCPEHRGREVAKVAPERVGLTLCRCGKTVLAGPGVPAGVTCPRYCHLLLAERPYERVL